jgi:regulator of PEP synthase PpsR (kinase-PPPase family)
MTQPVIYIVSGGEGTSGEQLVRTALAQFGEDGAEIVIVPHVRDIPQLEEAVQRAAAAPGSTIVHTLVDGNLRQTLIRLARDHQVEAIDLFSHLLTRLSTVLERAPLGQPGLYRQLREQYFERVEAIEFTVAHDDGRNLQGLQRAEIVLVGVSRSGKTPLSIYLSTQGWKVANVPLIRGVDPPSELFEIDASRVVALTIDPGQLVAHRRWRQRRLGLGAASGADSGSGRYVDAADIYEEVKAAREIAQRGGFAILDITDKPIEESAQEVISLVTRNTRRGS